MKELRQEIAAYMDRRFGLSYDPLGQILVTVGGSEAIDMCIRSLVAPGDEVIIPSPALCAISPSPPSPAACRCRCL